MSGDLPALSAGGLVDVVAPGVRVVARRAVDVRCFCCRTTGAGGETVIGASGCETLCAHDGPLDTEAIIATVAACAFQLYKNMSNCAPIQPIS